VKIILGNFHPNVVLLAKTFIPEILESQSKAQKTWILAHFPLKI